MLAVGFESEAVTATAKTVADLSPPAAAHLCWIQADGDVIRYTLDGSTVPTSSVGMILPANEKIEIGITVLKNIKFIRGSGACVLLITYFGGRDI